MNKPCITILLLAISICAQATQAPDKPTGKWLVVDQEDEMGTRYKALMLIGVVVSDESKGAILTLQKGKDGSLFFGLLLTVPAAASDEINIRFDQEEKQSYPWQVSGGTTAIMSAKDLLAKMNNCQTFRIEYKSQSLGSEIVRFDARGFQVAMAKLKM